MPANTYLALVGHDRAVLRVPALEVHNGVLAVRVTVQSVAVARELQSIQRRGNEELHQLRHLAIDEKLGVYPTIVGVCKGRRCGPRVRSLAQQFSREEIYHPGSN